MQISLVHDSRIYHFLIEDAGRGRITCNTRPCPNVQNVPEAIDHLQQQRDCGLPCVLTTGVATTDSPSASDGTSTFINKASPAISTTHSPTHTATITTTTTTTSTYAPMDSNRKQSVGALSRMSERELPALPQEARSKGVYERLKIRPDDDDDATSPTNTMEIKALPLREGDYERHVAPTSPASPRKGHTLYEALPEQGAVLMDVVMDKASTGKMSASHADKEIYQELPVNTNDKKAPLDPRAGTVYDRIPANASKGVYERIPGDNSKGVYERLPGDVSKGEYERLPGIKVEADYEMHEQVAPKREGKVYDHVPYDSSQVETVMMEGRMSLGYLDIESSERVVKEVLYEGIERPQVCHDHCSYMKHQSCYYHHQPTATMHPPHCSRHYNYMFTTSYHRGSRPTSASTACAKRTWKRTRRSRRRGMHWRLPPPRRLWTPSALCLTCEQGVTRAINRLIALLILGTTCAPARLVVISSIWMLFYVHFLV
jgi:hypothetical protein